MTSASPQPSLFPDPEPSSSAKAPHKSRKAVFEDYDGFVDKFKPKLTTDDCYTPDEVYKTVTQWVNDYILPLEEVKIVRPFYPGGDYEAYDYPEGCLVLDNPPFSILAKIRRFYHERGIRYFLFAPALVVASSAKGLISETCYIMANAAVEYANGAKVNTSFVTNLDCDGMGVWIAGDLCRMIEQAQAAKRAAAATSKYSYPMEVLIPSHCGRLTQRGVVLKIRRDEMQPINRLDCYKNGGRIYGGGFLLSERAAAERAEAEKMAIKRAAAEQKQEQRCILSLSDREKAIIASLGNPDRRSTP